MMKPGDLLRPRHMCGPAVYANRKSVSGSTAGQRDVYMIVAVPEVAPDEKECEAYVVGPLCGFIYFSRRWELLT